MMKNHARRVDPDSQYRILRVPRQPEMSSSGYPNHRFLFFAQHAIEKQSCAIECPYRTYPTLVQPDLFHRDPRFFLMRLTSLHSPSISSYLKCLFPHHTPQKGKSSKLSSFPFPSLSLVFSPRSTLHSDSIASATNAANAATYCF